MTRQQTRPVLPAPIAPQSRAVLADAALAADFRRDGYVQATILSVEEAIALREALDALRPLSAAPHGAVANGVVDYHCSAMDPDLDYRRSINTLIRATVEPRVTALLDGYRLLYATLYIKRDGLGSFPMHQNWPILSDLNDTSVTIWMPLVSTDGDSGGVRVVPGSHKLAPHINGPRTPSFYDEALPSLAARAIGPALRAGEALVFDDVVIHGSSPNRSGALRPAVQLICVPVDAVPVFYHDRRDGSFEMIHADSDFWTESDFEALGQRQPDWTGLGLIESRNRRIDEAELLALLGDGAAIRAEGFAPARAPQAQVQVQAQAQVHQPAAARPARRPLWRRVLRRLRG